MTRYTFSDYDAWCTDAMARGYLGPRQRMGYRRYEFLEPGTGMAAATWSDDDLGVVWGDPPPQSPETEANGA